jgi:hypothetical protein
MNVQQTIIKGIKEELFFHDYLVLPDFGGFVLHALPARFSGSGLILPPTKTVGFNIQLKQNDGILAAWLQRQLACTNAESLAHLKEFAEFCNHLLLAKRRLNFDGIGFFYLDFENHICFEPQQDCNFLSDSFGLAPIHVVETSFVKTQTKREFAFNDRKPTPLEPLSQKTSSIKRRITLLPLGLSMLILFVLILFVANSNVGGQFKSSVFGAEERLKYRPTNYSDLELSFVAEKNPKYVADANGIALLLLNNEKHIAVKVFDVIIEAPKLGQKKICSSSSNSIKQYEIVLGCFGILENAQRLALKLSQQQIIAVVSHKNEKGLYVVSSGSFDSKDVAIDNLKLLKSRFPNAWIKHP